MKKIIILNAGNSNKGNLALIYSTMNTIKYYMDDIEFILMGPQKVKLNGLSVKKQLSPGISIKKPQNTIKSIWYLFKCIFFGFMKKKNLAPNINKNLAFYEYYTCDLVINSGGDHLSGEYGLGVVSTLINIYCTILLDKPVILYGESLGYYKNFFIKHTAKYILNKTKMILVRENLSKKYLINNKITKPSIYLTADPAFLLKPDLRLKISEILKDEEIKINNPLIGINPSGLINKFEKNENTLNLILVKVINFLVNKLNASILLIPHVYTANADDRVSINEIYDNLENKDNVNIITTEYSPQELKSIIGFTDLFIGARMHATIASTSMIIPTIGIAYSHKMHGIIGEMLGLEDYIIDINDLNYEILIDKIMMAWENKKDIHTHLKKVIPEVKKRSMENGELVKELVDSLNIS